MLDINLFRERRGHDPEVIRQSQRRRFESVDLVDEVIHLDQEWCRSKSLSYLLSLKSVCVFLFFSSFEPLKLI